MKKEQVPQDDSRTYAGHKKVIYAVNQNNRYESIESSGWEPEEFVTVMAVNELERLTTEALQRVKANESSPLEYYMYKNRYDLCSLSQVTGLFQWQIKRHFLPRVFARLSDKKLSRYADVLGIDIHTLKIISL